MKRWEHSIRTSNATTPTQEENIQHEEIRRNIERAFFIPYDTSDENQEQRVEEEEAEAPVNEAEARLAADLRAAGLI